MPGLFVEEKNLIVVVVFANCGTYSMLQDISGGTSSALVNYANNACRLNVCKSIQCICDKTSKL